MLAHYHGSIWNAAEPARSLGVSQPTVRLYLDLLQSVFMRRLLRPWHESLLKRRVKAPKIYLRDSGLLHQLLGIATERDLMGHPKLGSSWEGYAIEEVLKLTGADDAYFWATHTGAELDLLLLRGGRRYGVEIKREKEGLTEDEHEFHQSWRGTAIIGHTAEEIHNQFMETMYGRMNYE